MIPRETNIQKNCYIGALEKKYTIKSNWKNFPNNPISSKIIRQTDGVSSSNLKETLISKDPWRIRINVRIELNIPYWKFLSVGLDIPMWLVRCFNRIYSSRMWETYRNLLCLRCYVIYFGWHQLDNSGNNDITRGRIRGLGYIFGFFIIYHLPDLLPTKNSFDLVKRHCNS